MLLKSWGRWMHATKISKEVWTIYLLLNHIFRIRWPQKPFQHRSSTLLAGWMAIEFVWIPHLRIHKTHTRLSAGARRTNFEFFSALSDDQCIVYNFCCFWGQYNDLATQEEQYSPSRMWINNNNYYSHNMISDELTQTYQRKCYQAKIVVWSQYRTKIEKEDISLGDIF